MAQPVSEHGGSSLLFSLSGRVIGLRRLRWRGKLLRVAGAYRVSWGSVSHGHWADRLAGVAALVPAPDGLALHCRSIEIGRNRMELLLWIRCWAEARS